MIICAATAADAGAIADIWNAIILDPVITFTSEEKSTEQLAQLITEQPVFAVKDGDEVVGFATYGVFRGGSGYRHTAELTIHLTPQARGRGVGRDLMLAILDHAGAQGVHAMVAGVSAANQSAIKFHQAMGFSEVGRMPEVGFKAGQWRDLVLLQKVLNT